MAYAEERDVVVVVELLLLDELQDDVHGALAGQQIERGSPGPDEHLGRAHARVVDDLAQARRVEPDLHRRTHSANNEEAAAVEEHDREQ